MFEKRALELDPHSGIFRLGTGIRHLYLGRIGEAIDELEKLIKTDPELTTVHLWKAWSHVCIGEFDQAIEDAKKATEILIGSLSKLNLASIYARASKIDQAVKLFDEMQSGPAEDYKSPAFIAMAEFDLGGLRRHLYGLRKHSKNTTGICSTLGNSLGVQSIAQTPDGSR